jgi:hypothetical protein
VPETNTIKFPQKKVSHFAENKLNRKATEKPFICHLFKVDFEVQIPRQTLIASIETQFNRIQRLRFELYCANRKHPAFTNLVPQERVFMEKGRKNRIEEKKQARWEKFRPGSIVKALRSQWKKSILALKKAMIVRAGKCSRCAACCISPEGKPCEHLIDTNPKTCGVYENRPRWCDKDFPRSQQDLDSKGVKTCSYRFANLFTRKPVKQ